MTNQTTPRDRLFALIASIPGSASVDWCDDARALVDEIATPPAPLPAGEARTRLLQALDAPYCQALGYTPEGLLAAYEASRTQTVDDRVLEALSDTLYDALYAITPFAEQYFADEAEGLRAAVRAVLEQAAVLPATTNHDTETSAARPTTLHAIARHLEARADRIFRAESQASTEYHAVAAMLRRVADETAATKTCDHDSQVIDHEGAQYWACLKCGTNLGRVEPAAGARQDGDGS